MLGEIIEQFAKDIKRMIQKIDLENNWNNAQKIYSFTKGLRDDIYKKMFSILAT